MNIFLQKHLQFRILLILADYIQGILFQCHHVRENLLLGKLFNFGKQIISGYI